MTRTNGPFRADHVGSLMRPPELLAARDKRGRGEISAEALRAIEDTCIRDAVRMQEEIGLQAITDGEFRRGSWNKDFISGFANVQNIRGRLAVFHRGEDGRDTDMTPSGFAVTGKLRRPHGIQVEEFKFLKSVTERTAKVCIPSPTLLHFRGGRGAIDTAAYPTMDAFYADLARVYNEEILELASLGLRYLQIDDTNFAYLCDARFREAAKKLGEDPDELPRTYARVINDAIRGRPEDMTVCVHICRGNASAGGAATGGYEPIAESLFNALAVDGFFLEFDDARSGDFAPLRFMPKDKVVVLGLITTKRAQLETKDELKWRIDQAAKYVPLERLALSPQCGFASMLGVTGLTLADQVAKLRLLVETAREVWGEG